MVLSSAGCIVPVMHPYRTHEGPGARAGVVAHFGAENSGSCDNEVGCKPSGAGGFSLLNVDGRWGHRFGDHVGVMGGVYFPGFRNQKTAKADAALMSYGVATFETPLLSLGLGPELGTRAAGGSVGLDFEPMGLTGEMPHFVSLSPYFRYLTPYRIEESDVNAKVPSWDTGAMLRVGPVVLTYAFYRQTHGVIDYVIYESSVRAQSWHMVMLGVEVNRDSLDFGPTEHPQLEPPEAAGPCAGASCFETPRRVPYRTQFPGCTGLCTAQAELECGLSKDECQGACEKREVPEECWDEDDALLSCQARAVACRDGRVWFPSCPVEHEAFDRCEVRAAIAR